MRYRALVLASLVLFAIAGALAQTPAPTGAAGSTSDASLSPATVTMLQKRSEDFLRNLYAWGPDFEVKAGDVKASVVPGLYEINVNVSLHGDSDSAVVYVTKDGRYMFRGDISDMNSDPFASIRQKLVLDGSPSKGPADAKIVMVEFGDFECPNCRQLDIVLREILPSYPQVRFVFKDFPLEQIHPWAMTAALVGRCAFKQSSEAFWKFHDLIYDNQDHITPENAYDKLLEYAADAGLDPTATRSCVSDPQITEAVRKTIAEGRSVDVTGTPTTFINGRSVIGPNEPLIRQYVDYLSH
jgi:protein-disulfide isomerase